MRASWLKGLVCLALAMLVAAPAMADMAPWEKHLYEAAKQEKEFTVYTAHYNSEEAAAICNAYDQRYPGVHCNFIRTTAQVAFQRLAQDMKAGLAVASVISTTDVSHYPRMKKAGWLMQYRPHNLANMIDAFKRYNDPDGYFYVTAAGLVLINYNTELVSKADAPKSWKDLLNPKWKNKIAIGHPAFSGYVGTWVVLMRKLYGWNYFTQLAKNNPQIGRSINDTVTMLNAKERWVGAGPAATTLRSRDKGNPLGVVYPSDGTLLMISPSGILKNAPSPNAAKLYMEFLMTKAAAKVEMKQRGESIVKGVKPLPGARSLEDVKTVRPTLEEIEKGIPEVKEQFRDTFGI